ncbi:MAG: hypothetical protein UY97_C0009G0026 [Parcubacteria group bacterium GW2011_GWB1_57_6]|nr:MAG: hypothetical protein UY97_C0009G0026 [Parcubacteria group bacterium GW2011_GWB1_57_6]
MKKELRGFFELHAPDTDLFCLQEASEHMRNLVREYLRDFNETTYPVRYRSAIERFDMATYVRKTVPVRHSELAFHDGERMSGMGICTEIEYRGNLLYVLNYGGISRPGKLDTPERIRQSKKILAYYGTKQGPKILGGDFNVLPETRSIQMFIEHGYRELVHEFAIPTTRNHLAWDRFPTKLLFSDYVFVSNDIEVKDFKVPDMEISDHLPLILECDPPPARIMGSSVGS